MLKNAKKQSNLYYLFTKTKKYLLLSRSKVDFNINKRINRDWSNKNEQRKFLEEVAKKLNIKDWREWKIKVSKQDIIQLGGITLIDTYYKGDFESMLTSLFPEHPWNSLSTSGLSRRFPHSLKEQRVFMEIAGKQYGIFDHNLEKWYKITFSEMEESSLFEFLEKYYSGSLIKALQNTFPEVKWKPWRFENSQKLPEKDSLFWSSEENQREFFNDFASDLQMKDWKDWYKVSFTQIIEFCSFPNLNISVNPNSSPSMNHQSSFYLLGGGREIMRQYDGSLFKALSNIYPFYPWDPSLFYFQPMISSQSSSMESSSSSSGTNKTHSIEDRSRIVWMNNQVVGQFLAKIENQLGLHDRKDWYFVKTSDIIQNGGSDILNAYCGSFIRPLVRVYKDYSWDFRKFSEIKESRLFLLEKAKALKVEKWEDWYQVTFDDLRKHGAVHYLQNYNGSPMKLIVNSFPEYPWQIWRFNRVPKHYWDNPDNIKDAIYGLADILGIHSYSNQGKPDTDGNLDDWYKVTYQQINSYGCKVIVDRFGGLIPLLSFVYPQHNWVGEDKNLHMKISNKSQLVLFRLLNSLFFKSSPECSDIHISYLHPQLLHTNSRKPMELDIYIPAYNIAFEYQGKQHYTTDIRHRSEDKQDFHFYYISDSNVSTIQERDNEKKIGCKSLGITLLEIPYWWDQTKESLKEIIISQRPDLKEVLHN